MGQLVHLGVGEHKGQTLVRVELEKAHSAGGLSALHAISDLGANPLTSDRFAKTVREYAARRHAIRAAHDVLSMAQTDGPAALSLGKQRFGETHEAFRDSDPSTKLHSISIEELFMNSTGTPPAYWPGVVYPGTVTLMVGWPKAGKAWIYAAFLAALRRGEEWLGHKSEIQDPKALVAAEEAPFGVAGWAKRFGLVSGVRFVTRSEAGPNRSHHSEHA